MGIGRSRVRGLDPSPSSDGWGLLRMMSPTRPPSAATLLASGEGLRRDTCPNSSSSSSRGSPSARSTRWSRSASSRPPPGPRPRRRRRSSSPSGASSPARRWWAWCYQASFQFPPSHHGVHFRAHLCGNDGRGRAYFASSRQETETRRLRVLRKYRKSEVGGSSHG